MFDWNTSILNKCIIKNSKYILLSIENKCSYKTNAKRLVKILYKN